MLHVPGTVGCRDYIESDYCAQEILNLVQEIRQVHKPSCPRELCIHTLHTHMTVLPRVSLWKKISRDSGFRHSWIQGSDVVMGMHLCLLPFPLSLLNQYRTIYRNLPFLDLKWITYSFPKQSLEKKKSQRKPRYWLVYP